MQSSNLSGKKISVIMVNFRSDQHLEKCIASLYNFEKNHEFEIIIINNDQEEKLEKIKTPFPKVKIIQTKINLGFGKAVNLGAKEAQGEILFFLNPDCEIKEEIFSKVQQKFTNNQALAALSPKIITQEGRAQAWIFGKKMNLWQLIINNLFGDRASSKELKKGKKPARIATQSVAGEEREVFWISGAGMFVRREDFIKDKGFDENFFLYFEDLDLCWRLQDLGKKIIYFPEIKISHLSSGSKISESERKKAYYLSQDYYFQKHFGSFQAKLVKALRKFFT